MTLLAVYAAAFATCAAALVVGAALCTTDRGWSWRAPAVGLAVLMALCGASIRLPGDWATALGMVALALLVSLLRLRGRVEWRTVAAGAPVALLTLLVASLPFIANRRIGPLGVSVLDDLSTHLVWAEALRAGADTTTLISGGYPIGPHALAATIARSTGGDVESAFLGLMLAIPVLAALTALTALDELPPRLRLLVAPLVGLPYLVAAYLAQASFKEPIQALLFLGVVLTLLDLARRRAGAAGAAVSIGVLAAGSIYVFSYPGLAWPIAAAACLLAAETAVGGRVQRLTRAGASLRRAARSRRVVVTAVVAGGVLLLAALPGLIRIEDFFHSTVGRLARGEGSGSHVNLTESVSGLEAFGVWFSRDFRVAPKGALESQLLPAFAVAVALYGAFRAVRGGELVVPAAVLAALAVYATARLVTVPYVSSKALVIAAPLITLVALRGLLSEGDRSSWLALGAGAAFVACAAGSTALVLRSAEVGPREGAEELAELRPLVAGARTAFLGRDAYARWRLRGAQVSSPSGFYLGKTPGSRPGKVGRFGPIDFDALTPGGLDRVRFVITPRTTYASAPPANFRRVRSGERYELWARRGPTPPRRILAEGSAPGAVLECSGGDRRGTGSRGGDAGVRPAPIHSGGDQWTGAGGPSGILEQTGFRQVRTGAATTQRLRVPTGLWELSLQYHSPRPLRVRAGTLDATIPPELGGRGPFWRVGKIRSSGGSTEVTVSPQVGRLLDVGRTAAVGGLALVPAGTAGEVVPLADACGRYVDWYVSHRNGD